MTNADVGVIVLLLAVIAWGVLEIRGYAKSCVKLLGECAQSLESVDGKIED
jgi:hypothetical protein